jgi:hypothetical protein
MNCLNRINNFFIYLKKKKKKKKKAADEMAKTSIIFSSPFGMTKVKQTGSF